MIRELSRPRLIWDTLILLLIVISSVLVAYQFAFDQAGALEGFQFIYLIDLFFLIDIAFNCVTTYRARGVEILDRKQCTAHYVRRHLGIDVLASVPFDLIAWLLIGNGHLLGGSLVLALRLLRLLRIVRLFVILKRWEAFSWSNPSLLRVIKYFVSILLLIHWLAPASGSIRRLPPGSRRIAGLSRPAFRVPMRCLNTFDRCTGRSLR